MRRALIRIATVVISVMATVYIAIYMPLPFVEAWWRAGEADYSDAFHKRHRIADGLILSRSLLGLTRDQIEERLGPAESPASPTRLVYTLGRERGFIAIDSEMLVVILDARGMASDAYTRTD